MTYLFVNYNSVFPTIHAMYGIPNMDNYYYYNAVHRHQSIVHMHARTTYALLHVYEEHVSSVHVKRIYF